MIISGKTIKYGDHVDTDVIIPARYLSSADAEHLGRHAMEDLDADFAAKVGAGRAVIVAGVNFGCGSSREHAPLALKAAGVKAVAAKSFARIFYRNALNIGLPIVECPEAVDAAKDGAQIDIDLGAGSVIVDGKAYAIAPFPPFMQELISLGGLTPWVSARLKEVSE